MLDLGQGIDAKMLMTEGTYQLIVSSYAHSNAK